jgi:hypothetical protein
MALSGSSQTRKKNLPVVNDDVVVSLLWGAHFHDQKWLFNEVATKHVDSKAWAIVASIASSPLCNADYLSYMANSIAKKLGYGYILRIIAKNPNVTIETLRSIAEDPALEERYTEVAKSKLKNFTY